MEEKKPPTPQRIRVGGGPQQVYLGPAMLWFPGRGVQFNDLQLTLLEQVVTTHPEDICARGLLIRDGRSNFWPGDQYLARIDDLLWMIQHHPEWDGFIILGFGSFSAEPQSEPSRTSFHRLREAWLRHTGPEQRSGMILHNAAMFFAHREPEFAVSLLQRAIRLEPSEPFYAERLGAVYTRAILPLRDSSQIDINEKARRETFAQQAQTALMISDNWVLIAGALEPISGMGVGDMGPPDLGRSLLTRLSILKPGPAFDQIRKLPSHSTRYRRTTCDTAYRGL